MPLKAYWAYGFRTPLSLERIRDLFNGAGPWEWTMRDSAWYGLYLNVRPIEGVRVRVHEDDGEYSVLAQIELDSRAEKAEIDAVVRELLERVDAKEMGSMEPYD